MALNAESLNIAAAALQQRYLYAQLHSAPSGDGTANISTLGRQSMIWSAASGGEFGLASQIQFRGADPDSTAYSITLWDQQTDGTCYGEILLSSGDLKCNAQGEFAVTAIDIVGSATDA